jgi:ribosome-binding factor A
MSTKRSRRPSPAKLNRKAQQLGQQVAETLGQVLAGLDDDVLRDLYVVSAEPAPDASRYVVTLAALPADGFDPVRVLERLEHAAGRLRAEVASAITRRRAPLLAYRFATSF